MLHEIFALYGTIIADLAKLKLRSILRNCLMLA